MPEDLLQALETPPAVCGNLETIADLERIAMRELGWAVEGMKGSAAIFENAWRRIVLEVAKRQTAEMQAARPRLLAALDNRLRLLRQTHALASSFRRLNRPDSPDPSILDSEIAALERLKASAFDRWQTPEDLEDLAARDFPLSTAELDKLGPTRRPPPSFYAADTKPF